MKRIMMLAMALAFSVVAYAAPKALTSKAMLTEAQNIKWTDVPDAKGLHTAVVEGDPTKGAHHVYMKFDAGFKAPLHHHTAKHFVTVVSGTLILTVDGVERRLPAGSYFAFNNMDKHETACAAGADCVIFADVRGVWDVVPEKQ